MNPPLSWATVVFASREGCDQLLLTVDAMLRAIRVPTVVDVLINGNPGLAAELASVLMSRGLTERLPVIRVWSLRLGDKANAWNHYIHHIWPGASVSFFVDGYVRVQADALKLLAEGMASDSRLLGGTGVPSMGRNAIPLREQMLKQGGIHGNLFAIKEQVVKALRLSNFKLPLGIYRTDPTLGAALAFGLDPAQHQWDLKGRILVHPGVTWKTDIRPWWRFGELKSQFKRTLRQAQGDLENRAVKEHLAHKRRAPEMLPRTAAELVTGWITSCPGEANAVLWQKPLTRLALRKLREPRDWSAAQDLPELAFSHPDQGRSLQAAPDPAQNQALTS